MRLNRFRSKLLNCASDLRRWLGDSRGNVSLIFGLSAIPLVAIGTMAVDFSNGMRIKSELQAAADAGVLAAATALASGQDDQSKEAIAEETFFANLSEATQAAFVVEPNPQVDFENRIITMTVNVQTDQLVTTLLTDKLGIGVLARARVHAGKPICMMSFNPTAKESIYMNGSADVSANGCSIQVNSNHDEALRQVGTGQAEAESFCVHGDFVGDNYTPSPQKRCLQEEDPLDDYFAAAWGQIDTSVPCTSLNNLFGNGNGNGNNNGGGTTVFLEPGIYCGDLTVSSGDTLILTGSDTSVPSSDPMKDVYVFMNSDIFVAGGGTIRNFWNGSDGAPPSGNFSSPSQQAIVLGPNSGTLSIQGGADVWLNAKSTGTFAGLAISQHPDATLNNSEVHLVTGGGDVNMNGIVYLPSQPLEIAGNGVIGADTSQFAIMADTIEIRGDGALEIRIGADYQAAGLPQLPEAEERIVLTK